MNAASGHQSLQLSKDIRVCSCLADFDKVRDGDASLQLVQPVATATALPVKAVNAASGSSKPKQTLEEMAAWLDARLAAAPGNSQSLMTDGILAFTAGPRPRTCVNTYCKAMLSLHSSLGSCGGPLSFFVSPAFCNSERLPCEI